MYICIYSYVCICIYIYMYLRNIVRWAIWSHFRTVTILKQTCPGHIGPRAKTED